MLPVPDHVTICVLEFKKHNLQYTLFCNMSHRLVESRIHYTWFSTKRPILLVFFRGKRVRQKHSYSTHIEWAILERMLLLQRIILHSHTKYEYLSCLVKFMIEVLWYGNILFTSISVWFRYRILWYQFSQVVSCLIYFI